MGLRSMFSGISGLQAHSTWLDVIGNNISNTNTVAYKASRVEFADQISQTLYGGTGDNPGSNLGGVNPEQVGLGTRVASIQTLFTEGTIQNTGNSTDIALVGNGFMLSKSGNTTLLTRAGNLTFDGAGNLVDQNGGFIQGFTSTVQYNRVPLDTAALGGGNFPAGVAPGNMTNAVLTLDNTNPAAASNIHISRDFVLPPKATTEVDFSGNLDSFQQAATPGGVTQLGPVAAPVLPIGLVAVTLNGPKLQKIPYGLGNAIQQTGDLAQPPDPANPDPTLVNHTQAAITGGENLNGVIGAGANYAWMQQPPIPPAHVAAETVYDSTGNPRQITIQFYQVNDLGTAVPPVNVPPLSQTAYAWYAFDTTNGAKVSNLTLIGGSGIIEGDIPSLADRGYDRGLAGNQYLGDLIYFNTDGSLASEGGVMIQGGVFFQDKADVYLPPIQPAAAVGAGPAPPVSPIPNLGAEVTRVTLNFGTAGMLGFGKRDGVTGDAEGSYQVVNGVNTYVPNSTIFAKTQNGYSDGLLTGVQFDRTGTIVGSFTNGQNVALGQIVMAMPENQGGLSKVGSNYFAQSANSGGLFVGLAGQDGVGTVQGNSLELSNVDLTVELSNMIIAQRGFEVNARVISVTNSTLQTTVQLGQGG